jgi:hypothetical protein
VGAVTPQFIGPPAVPTAFYAPYLWSVDPRLAAIKRQAQGGRGTWADPVGDPANWFLVLVGTYTTTAGLNPTTYLTPGPDSFLLPVGGGPPL